MTCFCHNSCCLSYVMSLANLYFRKHIGHGMLSDISISHGSVATPLRCGGICNDIFIANFLLSVIVKNFENRSLFGKVMDKSLVSCFLWTTVYHLIDFVFDSRVGFSATADRMHLVPDGPNPRGDCPLSWNILTDHISTMGYPLHFHEVQGSFRTTQQKTIRCLLSAESEPYRLPACSTENLYFTIITRPSMTD